MTYIELKSTKAQAPAYTDEALCEPAKPVKLPHLQLYLLQQARRFPRLRVGSTTKHIFEIRKSPYVISSSRRRLPEDRSTQRAHSWGPGGIKLIKSEANRQIQSTGGQYVRCDYPSCTKKAMNDGLCVEHTTRKCAVASCYERAQHNGCCKVHGGGVKCARDGCNNTARRKGLCTEHGGRHLCKKEGCTRCAHRGGFCISHGGGRRCSVTDCPRSAQSGGACYSHGGGKRCCFVDDGEKCTHAARSGGYCIKHGKIQAKNQADKFRCSSQ